MGMNLNSSDLSQLAKVVSDLFEEWKLKSDQQRDLFGGEISSKQLRAMQGGNAEFPNDKTLLLRAEHLLAIHDCLRTAYPRSPSMAVHWINTKNRHFDKRSPIMVMINEGMDGLRSVRVHLDCTMNWHD